MSTVDVGARLRARLLDLLPGRADWTPARRDGLIFSDTPAAITYARDLLVDLPGAPLAESHASGPPHGGAGRS